LQLEANRYATPILATDLAAALGEAYHKELTGLFHVAGSERTTPYGFGLAVSDVFALSPSCLQPTWRQAGDSNNPSPHETSLGTDRIRRALGRSMPMLYEGLQRLRQQRDNGFADRLRTSVAAKSVARKKSSLGNVA
jgi:dTDP-4-dehydrorhamnose reductase